jgi:hypothetical protein
MRKVLSTLVVFSLLAVAGLSTASAATVAPVNTPAAASADAHGARACFGIGTNNCCGEFMVLGVIAAVTGNLPALAIATGASYAYCYN